MSKDVVRIQVDHREAKSDVLDELRIMPAVEVEVVELKTGDYFVENGLVVERKTLVDLARSLIDGRLFSQALRLSGAQPRAAVILEGQSTDLAGTQIRREALLGAIISLSVIYDLAVLRSKHAAETAHVLVYAAQQLRRQGQRIPFRHGGRPKGKRRVQLRVLAALPGIGPKKAEKLLDRFGSVEAVVRASIDDLREGLGAKTAAQIRWALD